MPRTEPIPGYCVQLPRYVDGAYRPRRVRSGLQSGIPVVLLYVWTFTSPRLLLLLPSRPPLNLAIALFYTREEMGLRTAFWWGSAAVASAFSGLIAFGIQHVHTSVANWRLLFIIEGVPTVLLGFCAMFVLPNRPEETHILSAKEREIALQRVNRGSMADAGRVIQKSASMIKTPSPDDRLRFRQNILSSHSRIGRCVESSDELCMFVDSESKIYAIAVVYFAGDCATAGITAFLPTIIMTFGFSGYFAQGGLTRANVSSANARAQLLTVPPYAVAAVVLLLTSYASDRLQSRGMIIAASCFVAGVGYMCGSTVVLHQARHLTSPNRLLLAVTSNSVRYFATFCITMGSFSTIGLVLTWCR